MTSSIRKVLRKALLSLQLPAAKEGQECGDVMMSWDALNLQASRFAEPKNTGCLYTKMISLDYMGIIIFSHWNSNLGMNKWWLLGMYQISSQLPCEAMSQRHLRDVWMNMSCLERMNGWILENPGRWAQISHPPTRTANEKPWFSIGDLHIYICIYIYTYIYMWNHLGVLDIRGWWGMGFLSVLG